jgi:hypothetical protein
MNDSLASHGAERSSVMKVLRVPAAVPAALDNAAGQHCEDWKHENHTNDLAFHLSLLRASGAQEVVCEGSAKHRPN